MAERTPTFPAIVPKPLAVAPGRGAFELTRSSRIVAPDDGARGEDVLAVADRRLYEEKRERHGSVGSVTLAVPSFLTSTYSITPFANSMLHFSAGRACSGLGGSAAVVNGTVTRQQAAKRIGLSRIGRSPGE